MADRRAAASNAGETAGTSWSFAEPVLSFPSLSLQSSNKYMIWDVFPLYFEVLAGAVASVVSQT